MIVRSILALSCREPIAQPRTPLIPSTGSILLSQGDQGQTFQSYWQSRKGHINEEWLQKDRIVPRRLANSLGVYGFEGGLEKNVLA